MNRRYFLSLISATLLTCAIHAMENQATTGESAQFSSCSRWDTLRWRFHFSINGYDQWGRDRKLTEFAKNYDPKNLALMQHLMCANKTLFRRASKSDCTAFTDSFVIYDTNKDAFEIAICSNNIPLAKAFLHNFDLRKGWPRGGIEAYPKFVYLGPQLQAVSTGF